MASIDRRPDGRYRARWREYPGGPQRTRHFTRKGDAERFLDSVRGDLVHGTYVDPAGGQVLFRDYAERWRTAQMHRPTTAAQAETYLRLHAYPTLGKRPLGAVRRSEIQAWVKHESTRLAPGSVELVYRWVSTIFKSAVSDRLIASSPCIGITLPKRHDTEVVPLSVAQVEALAGAVPDRHRALIVFAAGTGLRQGGVLRAQRGPARFPEASVASRPPAHLGAGFGAGVRATQEPRRVSDRSPARRGRLGARRPPGSPPCRPSGPHFHQPGRRPTPTKQLR